MVAKKFVWALVFILFPACMNKGGTSPTSPTETKVAAPAAPSAQVLGLVSFNFDDGRLCSFQTALPMIERAGWKSTNYIITHPTGSDYVTSGDVISLEIRGHEVGNHTRTHEDLTLMTAAQQDDEIEGAKQDLLKMGVKSVDTFAYPFGAYNNGLLSKISGFGYLGARTTDNGANQRGTNRFALKRMNLGGAVTIDNVKAAVDGAIRENTWLILLSHHVDHLPNDYSVTPELYQQIVDYVASKKVKVVTNREGIKLMGL